MTRHFVPPDFVPPHFVPSNSSHGTIRPVIQFVPAEIVSGVPGVSGVRGFFWDDLGWDHLSWDDLDLGTIYAGRLCPGPFGLGRNGGAP